MRTKAPIAQKDLKVYPVEDYPYMVEKKYGTPRYFRSYNEARKSMRADLDSLHYSLVKRLNDQEAAVAIDEARIIVDNIPESGGSVAATVDPFTGVKYQAVLVKREGF